MPVRVKSGRLFFDFSWRGIRCKEYTGLPDTAENRQRCEQKIRVVERETARGTFDYRHHFPRGSRLYLFHPELRSRDGAAVTFGDYIREWQRQRSPILSDGRVVRDADLHPSTWIHDGSVVKRLVAALGMLRLTEITPAHCNALRRAIIDDGRSGKTAANTLGLLHKALTDAVEEGLLERNPVLHASSRKLQRSRRAQRLTANPLRPDEVARFLENVPEWYRDFYTVWFHTGWRSSEIVAIRFGWLDFRRQTASLRRGRMPRLGGLEAEPKTGPREVDCSYAPEIFSAFERLRQSSEASGPEDFVFTSPAGRPLSQEWLNRDVWRTTLERADISRRGQYCIRDTFITLALSAGEDPGWVAQVCGTSEEMIFRHYRRWIPGLRPGAGDKIGALLRSVALIQPEKLSPKPSLEDSVIGKAYRRQGQNVVREGGLEPPRACAHKVLSLARLPFRHSRA
jgi:integrase